MMLNRQSLLSATLCVYFSLLFLTLLGCQSLPKNHDLLLWTPASAKEWIYERRAAIHQLTVLCKVRFIDGNREEVFDAFMLLDNKGKGRIDGLGPLRSPLFYLLFDQTSFHLYVTEEAILYYGRNIPRNIQAMTGIPFNLQQLFDIIASNPPYPVLDAVVNECNTFTLGGADRGFSWDAAGELVSVPVIRTLTWRGEGPDNQIIVKYGNEKEVARLFFPFEISLEYPGGGECYIRINSLKINTSAPDDLLRIDPLWLEGEMIPIGDFYGEGG